MSREELLRRLDLACGDLPLDQPELAKLKGDPTPEFVPQASDDANPIELASDDGGGFMQTLPPIPYAGGQDGGYPGFPGFPFAPPMGGGGGRIPNSPTIGTTVFDNPPPVAEAPEPGTFLMLFTGLSGVVEIVRRRRAS